MNYMRFLILNTDYLKFVESEYGSYPDLKLKKFDDQLKFRYESLFGMSNYYSKNLIDLGHEAADIFINHPYLQKQWALENGVLLKNNFIDKFPKLWRLFKPDWHYKVLEAQISYYKPDVLYIMCMENVSNDFLRKTKKRFKNIKIIGQHAAPLTPNMQHLDRYDLVLSSLPNQVDWFNSKGVKSKHFKLGFEENILKKLKKNEKPYDVTHIGSYGKLHQERNDLLEAIAKEVDVKFWGFNTSGLSPESGIMKNYQGEAWGLEMYNILYNSRITLTKHITSVADKFANNMTLYEATGAGTLLLVDKKDNLGDIFEIGKEVVAYDSAVDLIGKIKYFLAHEEERQWIALAGQTRTLKEHTYKNRMSELLNIVQTL